MPCPGHHTSGRSPPPPRCGEGSPDGHRAHAQAGWSAWSWWCRPPGAGADGIGVHDYRAYGRGSTTTGVRPQCGRAPGLGGLATLGAGRYPAQGSPRVLDDRRPVGWGHRQDRRDRPDASTPRWRRDRRRSSMPGPRPAARDPPRRPSNQRADPSIHRAGSAPDLTVARTQTSTNRTSPGQRWRPHHRGEYQSWDRSPATTHAVEGVNGTFAWRSCDSGGRTTRRRPPPRGLEPTTRPRPSGGGM
jgi:hypothetical protein